MEQLQLTNQVSEFQTVTSLTEYATASIWHKSVLYVFRDKTAISFWKTIYKNCAVLIEKFDTNCGSAVPSHLNVWLH